MISNKIEASGSSLVGESQFLRDQLDEIVNDYSYGRHAIPYRRTRRFIDSTDQRMAGLLFPPQEEELSPYLLKKIEKDIAALPTRIDRVTQSVLNSNEYRMALEGFRTDNQTVLAKFIPRIFEVKLVRYEGTLYHGLFPRPSDAAREAVLFDSRIHAEEYVEGVISISQRDGLKPSNIFTYETDQQIKATYFTGTPDLAHGPVFFYMYPQDFQRYALFGNNIGQGSDEETLIYSPVIPPDRLRMGLKSSKYGFDINVSGPKDPRWADYRNQVEELLVKRQIPFEKFNPEGP